MDIPYTVHERPDTGLFNAKLGIWLFLASEVMLFGGLFSSYVFLRIGNPDWPMGSHYLNIPLGLLNTLVLITSSVTVVLAWVSLRQKNLARFKIFIGSTLACAFIFLIIKSFEYHAKFEHHYFPSHNTYMAIYFVLTGLHAIHVIGGIVVLSYFLGPGTKMWKTDPERFTNRIEIAGIYWHFVDLVWIFLFPILYLL